MSGLKSKIISCEMGILNSAMLLNIKLVKMKSNKSRLHHHSGYKDKSLGSLFYHFKEKHFIRANLHCQSTYLTIIL